MMLRIEQDNEQFVQLVETAAPIYSQAFAGYPWFEDISIEVARQRILENVGFKGFSGFVAFQDEKMAGLSWLDTPELEALIQRGRNDHLQEFIDKMVDDRGQVPLIYVRDTLVKPEFQGQGIASALKRYYLEFCSQKFENGALMLTRHREDNIAIIKGSIRWGFQPTGVRVPTSADPSIHHEYWYKYIPES